MATARHQILGVFFLLFVALFLYPLLITREPHGSTAAPAIAISISGASRGDDALKHFAASLLQHAIDPARLRLVVDVYISSRVVVHPRSVYQGTQPCAQLL